MTQTIRKVCKTFNSRKPEVVVICHEMDPRAGAIAAASAGRKPPPSAHPASLPCAR